MTTQRDAPQCGIPRGDTPETYTYAYQTRVNAKGGAGRSIQCHSIPLTKQKKICVHASLRAREPDSNAAVANRKSQRSVEEITAERSLQDRPYGGRNRGIMSRKIAVRSGTRAPGRRVGAGCGCISVERWRPRVTRTPCSAMY